MLVALTLFACGPAPKPADGPAPADSIDTSAPAREPIDCSPFCVADPSDADVARCYACRCKDAMDGWLPSPEELQCANGAPIEVYTADASGALTRVDEEVSTCANPTLLYGTCAPGGTLGQLTHGDVSVRWICRRNTFRPDHDDPAAPFEDVGAILYNRRTGASCWFDDMDGTGLHQTNWPNMDLTAPDADLEAWTSLFYHTNGDGCVGCHDNDPFLYTPYLQSVSWETGAWTTGPFHLLKPDGGQSLTGNRALISPEAAACTSCHRITSGATCSSWAPDSVGLSKGGGVQDIVAQAANDPESPLWRLGTWMPPEPGDDPHAWETRYRSAVDHITACCRRPGEDQPATDKQPACVWADVP